jgi:hypothetical protein
MLYVSRYAICPESTSKVKMKSIIAAPVFNAVFEQRESN